MLNKNQFAEFRKESEKALQELAEKYNVNIIAGKIKYTEDSFNLDLQVAKKEIDGKSFEQSEFEKNCFMYGLSPKDYKKEISYGGNSYTITGFKPRSTKYPILAKRDDGKVYKLPLEIVRTLLTA